MQRLGTEYGDTSLSSAQAHTITGYLHQWCSGRADAVQHLIPLIYEELRIIARAYARKERKAALQTTEIVHETYLELFGNKPVYCRNRVHFLALAARVMRRVLVTLARRRDTSKRGANMTHVPLAEAENRYYEEPQALLDLDQAIAQLEKSHPRGAAIVEARFFGGISLPDIAAHLAISESTVSREWRHAKAWLHARLNEGMGHGS